MRWLKLCPFAERLALQWSLFRGRRLAKSAMVVSDGELVTRHLFAPSMGETPAESELRWPNVFQFSSQHGGFESLVWRRYAPDDNCVDSLGRQSANQAARLGRNKKYMGSRTAKSAEIHLIRNKNGHGFNLLHAPEEGIHHAHIGFRESTDLPLTKADKSELKVMLRKYFYPDGNCA